MITPQEGEVHADDRRDDAKRRCAPIARTLAQAKFNLDNTIIRAPISGQTGGLLVKRGNLVRSGGAAPLVVINQVRPIYGALLDSVVAAGARAAVRRERRLAGGGGAGRHRAGDAVDRLARSRGKNDGEPIR